MGQSGLTKYLQETATVFMVLSYFFCILFCGPECKAAVRVVLTKASCHCVI